MYNKNDIYEIKNLLGVKSKLKKTVNGLRYIKRLFFNIGVIGLIKIIIREKRASVNFSNIWKEEIIKNLNEKENWRRNSKTHLDMIDFVLLKKIFKILVKNHNSIIDIGSYDGYFIDYYKNFKKIILSDLTEHSNLYPDNKKFEFIKLNGKDLNNIPSSYTDVIFSISTLVRVNKKTLKNYFENFPRIVKCGGILIVHVPNFLNINSLSMSFTLVSSFFYKKILSNYFDEILFDNNIHTSSATIIAKRNYKEFVR
tara:strand:+ start:777 stop:1541 length:765 start_codon:yes stop_codon:yes gene_type:complete